LIVLTVFIHAARTTCLSADEHCSVTIVLIDQVLLWPACTSIKEAQAAYSGLPCMRNGSTLVGDLYFFNVGVLIIIQQAAIHCRW